MRADALHRVLLARRPRSVEAIGGLAELWSWPRLQIEVAIADLVADGRLTDDAHGQLVPKTTA